MSGIENEHFFSSLEEEEENLMQLAISRERNNSNPRYIL